jgi:putative hydrolase of the HAD superfamily
MDLQAVIFDYGNVLSLAQPESAIQEMAAKVCLDIDEFVKHYWALRAGYDAGIISGPEYWKEFAARGGCTMNEDIAREMIDMDNRSWARENKAMTDFAHAVRKAGFRTAILSNMPPDFRDYLPVGVQWLPTFDHSTLSCELQVTKPDAAIYEHCIRGLRVMPDCALFIDDRDSNIEAAQALGLQTILFRDTEQALEEARRLTALPLPKS